jgi:hypothetical protein
MGKINNYTVGTAKAGDKIICSDADTGVTKNITPQEIIDIERSTSIYRAYLTQTGVTAPVATLVPGNTITGTWSYDGVGQYIFTSTGTFDNAKAGMIIGVSTAEDNTFDFSVLNDNEVSFNTYSAGVAQDALLDDLYVELIVHTV